MNKGMNILLLIYWNVCEIEDPLHVHRLFQLRSRDVLQGLMYNSQKYCNNY